MIMKFSFYRRLRSLDHGKLLIHLCIALIGMYVTFIMGVHSTGVPVLCAIVGAMLQYFFLVTFMIMAAQTVDLYYKLVVVVGGEINFYVLKATLLCWSKKKAILKLNIILFSQQYQLLLCYFALLQTITTTTNNTCKIDSIITIFD